ncbi:response regulator [Serpentinicella alkaliphila]|uniref:Stage 0 sporulation protein A homolog n=1 Tax=Serpentinicella alkaliphila TaxID=1734049 RepID=A0A4V2T305_9FIRM|nr:response regulator transcription factor [Serpentinicella alkaliphila]QUH26080.1 response regulator transcription factor [Serpentinicella alkaliphila]TCP99093.1 two-component system alkaline phosphatase synthesis response regulator PhoP [Serpentinicella alkaliphila]
MLKKKILIVDDEEHILELIKFNLEKNGFEVLSSDNGEDCIQILEGNSVDLLVLDLMLPGMDGIDVCKEIRKIDKFNNLPIIMLTAKGEETDRILGLELGADDYITKPFSVRELVARIKAVLRRTDTKGIDKQKILKLKGISLDTEKHEVTVDGNLVDLTLKEFELLKMLIANRGKVLSRNTLLDDIWGFDYFGETRTVDVHIRHLRKKIGDDETGEYIETIRGVGYKMK